MRLLSWLLCAAAAIVPVITSEEKSISRPKRDSSEKKIVCYYTNWSVYRPGTAKFSPQNINPYLCTHLIYAFGGLSKENALKPFDKYQDIEQGGYAKFNGLKTYNKNLKTMLAIGGWNEGSARFSPLVADAERRRELVKNTVKFLRQNHFDGLDLDWEYPSFRDGGKPRDRDNYATLVQEFREEFERESEKTGRTRLLLTMAVPAGIEYIDKGYDVPKLNKYLDWMNILSYDYHSAFEPTINHHSPLFSLEEDDEYNFDAQLSIDYTVQHYIKLGADRSKLVLGIPTYGRSYTLFNPDATDIGSPADGPGEQGEATREKGYLAYYEICERVKSGGWSIENSNPEAMGPYAYKDNQWVGYDDEDIARAKAKYVNDNDLGGIMFWSIDNDDFRGKCHGKPYPIIEAAKEALLASANELVPTNSRSSSSRSSSKKQEEESSSRTKPRKSRIRTKSTTTTEASKAKSTGRTTTTPQPPTTPDPGSDFVCKDEGFFPHPRDCKKYFWCLDSGPSSLGIVAHQFTCPSGLVFNKISDSCDYARNVICKTKTEAATTTTTTTTSTTTARTTTARSRLVITASPPRTTSTTTTTEPPEEDDAEEDEEDPGTIKELINLIKKLGGVEQLEKQLNLQNSDGKEKIKPSLYSRVLQGRTANRYRGVNEESSSTTTKYTSLFRNRPVAPQSPSTDETSTAARAADKPRYVTIQRNRPTKKPTKVEEESEEEEEEEEVEEVKEPEQPKRKEETPRSFRRRPNNDAATTEKEYVTLRRSRPPKEEEITTSKYKSIVRVRSTTEAAVEQEDEEEEEEVEEEISEEEEEEAVEEEREPEPGQKLKKYSSIVRDNKKIVSDEEESKVSGSQGTQYTVGAPSSTTLSTFEVKDNVNNVNTVTSPRYVEIRRTQPTTIPSEDSVNIVNTLQENDKATTPILNETNEVSESEPQNNANGFQRRITTEIVKRPTRPSLRFSTFERTTPLSVESTSEDVPRFRGRFVSRTTTESQTPPEIKTTSRYRTLNRNNADKPILVDENESNLPKREKSFKTSTTTSTTTPNLPNNGAARRFQFAPRTKPNILSPKPETTTQSFTITVPDLPDSSLTENILGFSFNSQYPSATLEPATATAPSDVDSTDIDVTENDVVTIDNEKKFPSTRYVLPTTSTLTSVVTSITESSYTERKKISVPKKARFKPDLGSKYQLEGTTEEIYETTKPYFRPTGYKTIVRSTTQASESTTARRRRFQNKSTTTTTEEPEPVKKYIPKKTRTFKKIVSTEVPEVTSSTTQRYRFLNRNKPRVTENGPNNALFSRFNTERRKKIFSKKEEDEDDLDVEQTATFFGDDVDNNDKYILAGAFKETSERDYLNADVLFQTVPTVEEEEKLAAKADEELAASLNSNKNEAVANKTDNRESLRSRFITNNANLRNLRTRTRPNNNVKEVSTEKPEASTRSTFSSIRANATTRSLFAPNRNGFRNLRGRTSQNNTNEEIIQESNDAAQEPVKDNQIPETKVPIRSNLSPPSSRGNTFRLRSRTPTTADNSAVRTEESLTTNDLKETKNRIETVTSRGNNFRLRSRTPTAADNSAVKTEEALQANDLNETKNNAETGTPRSNNFRLRSRTPIAATNSADKVNEVSENNVPSPISKGSISRLRNKTPVISDSLVDNLADNQEATGNNVSPPTRLTNFRLRNRTPVVAENSADKLEEFSEGSVSTPSSRTTNFKLRTRTPTVFDDLADKADEILAGDTKEQIKANYYTPDPNLNFKSTRLKFGPTTEITNGARVPPIDSNDVEEAITEEPIKPFTKIRPKVPRTTEASIESSIAAGNFRQQRGRTRLFNENVSEGTTKTDFFSSSRSTKAPLSTSSQARFRSSRFRTEPADGVTKSILGVGDTRIPDLGTVTYTRTGDLVPTISDYVSPTDSAFDGTTFGVKVGSTFPKEVVTVTQGELVSNYVGSTVSTSAGTPSTTFGIKVGSTVGSTGNSISGFTFASTPSTTFGSTSNTRFGSSSGATADSITGSSFQSTVRSSFNGIPKEPTRGFYVTVDPITDLKNAKTRARQNEETKTTTETVAKSTVSSNGPRVFRGRTKAFTAITSSTTEEPQDPISSNVIPSTSSQSNFRALRNRNRGKVSAAESLELGKVLNDSVESENRNGRTIIPKERRKVLVRARPVQSTVEPKEEDNELEPPEEPSTSSKTLGRKGSQDLTNLRSRGRSTTQSPTTAVGERTERRRTQLDRRRLRPETRVSTIKPEVVTETSTSNSRANILLRRRPRPSTSTTTTTTTTTEEPYIEQQEDSRLEESKSLDEDIQDLADPVVVAFHNLASVSPGPNKPIAPIVTSSLNPYSQTPATYTVHVTPSDIASFTTPSRIVSVTPGSVSSRPTSILTLKPYTIPVITKQYLPKQTPIPIRTPSPFRGTGISIPVTEEPYSPQSELLIQSRRPEPLKARPAVPIASAITQKQTTAKPRRVKPFSKVPKQEVVQSVSSPETPVDYEYYDEDEDPLANIPASALKVKVHSDGYIECLDRGNFPHPFSCKKFISCAKMENNELLGWEYTCPKHLSFDPVGGICNWSAGLGCQH